MQVKKVEERLFSRGIALRVDEAAISYLAERGFDPAFGARPVKRAIQRELESSLAKVTTKVALNRSAMCGSARPFEGRESRSDRMSACSISTSELYNARDAARHL